MPTKSHTLSADDRKHIDESKYAFPDQRKEPLENASHVRNAIARFDQVKDSGTLTIPLFTGRVSLACPMAMPPLGARKVASPGMVNRALSIIH